MKTVNVLKAAPTCDEVESVTIVIDQVFPDICGTPCSLSEVAFVHDDNAERVVDALCAALPGGTLDRVLAQLFARRSSLLSIPLFPPDKEEKS